MGERA
jgi:hypothetical protein